MKRVVVSKVLLFVLSFCIGISAINKIKAQSCSEASLFQKYWQYKNRFNKSFMVQDRDPSGCVNDGIGFTPPSAASSTSCEFTKAGFGLPATNFMISPNGWGVPGATVNQRWDSLPEEFNDHDCPLGLSWSNSNDPNHKFNWGTRTGSKR